MPTVGPFHVFYWATTSTAVTVVGNVGGYPTWQSAPISMVVGMGLGGAEPIYQAMRRGLIRLVWAIQTAWHLRRMDDERRKALRAVFGQLESPAFDQARVAVRMTSRTLGLNEPAAWKQLSHDLHRKHEWAENTYRHLHACSLTDDMVRATNSTIANPERNLLVELAYHGYRDAPKGAVL